MEKVVLQLHDSLHSVWAATVLDQRESQQDSAVFTRSKERENESARKAESESQAVNSEDLKTYKQALDLLHPT